MRELTAKPHFQVAERALKLLEAREGPDAVDYAYDEVAGEARRQFFLKRGLKPDNGSCALRLLGKHMRKHDCACLPPGADHPVLWRKNGKPVLFSFEPYGLSSERSLGLIEFCARHGLEFHIDARWGAYYPGQTVCVMLWPKGKENPLWSDGDPGK